MKKKEHKSLTFIPAVVKDERLNFLYLYSIFPNRQSCQFVLDNTTLAQVMLMGVEIKILREYE